MTKRPSASAGRPSHLHPSAVPPQGQVCVHRHRPAPNPPRTDSISPSQRHNPLLPLHNLLRTRCAALSDLRRAQHRLFAGRRCSDADQVTSGLERPRSGLRTIPMRFPVERKQGRTQNLKRIHLRKSSGPPTSCPLQCNLSIAGWTPEGLELARSGPSTFAGAPNELNDIA